MLMVLMLLRGDALCLSIQADSRLAAASAGSRLAAFRPTCLSRLAGDLGTSLLGELASASGTTLATTQTAELDGGRILGALGGRSDGVGLLRWERQRGLIFTKLVSGDAIVHIQSMWEG